MKTDKVSTVNKHGIRVKSSYIPKDRKGVNNFYEKFTPWIANS